MIYLTKGQKLFNNEGMVVCDPTGYYEDGSTVACAVFHSPDEPVYRYEAKFIAYGDQVYNASDQDKLMEEIVKIDPESLLGKTQEEVSVDKMIEKIQTVDNPTPELTPETINETSKPTTPPTPEPAPDVVPEPTPEVLTEQPTPEPEVIPTQEVIPEIVPDVVPETPIDAPVSVLTRKNKRKLV